MKPRHALRWLVVIACWLLLSVGGVGWTNQSPWGQGGVPAALEDCEEALAECQEGPCITFPGDGYTGAELSYTDHGDGTFTDDNTGLMWEIKTGEIGTGVFCELDPMPPVCFDVSDVNNWYTWTDRADGDYTNPDGLIFTLFLPTLNHTCGGDNPSMYCESDADCASAPVAYCGLGGHMDWRLPTIKELHSLVDYSASYPPVHPDFPGVMKPTDYWSSTSVWSSYYQSIGSYARVVRFHSGEVTSWDKDISLNVRAVRDIFPVCDLEEVIKEAVK